MNQGYKNLSEKDLNRLFAKTRFKLSDDQMDTVEFALWHIYYVERSLGDVLVKILKGGIKSNDGSYEELIEYLIDRLFFTEKINIFEKASSTNRPKNLLKYLRKINNIRNDVYHGRIDNLKYDGKNLTSRETKEKLIDDLDSALNDAVEIENKAL
ncbi:MAG: hypothetical protein A3J76_05545 [Candidatus Moranbacteria bacterium RBG_13_45_13]|nr:MAG: hypothetical protein A3J76_05545 [Candidatus Moranbacteria bacterium RBG_13_45_13]